MRSVASQATLLYVRGDADRGLDDRAASCYVGDELRDVTPGSGGGSAFPVHAPATPDPELAQAADTGAEERGARWREAVHRFREPLGPTSSTRVVTSDR